MAAQQPTASARYPEVLENLNKAIAGYSNSSQFKEGEEYASVTVSSNVPDVTGFMNYLSSAGDDLKDVNSMGSWSVNVQQVVPNEPEKTTTVVDTPEPQPPSNPVAVPKISPLKIKQESVENPSPRAIEELDKRARGRDSIAERYLRRKDTQSPTQSKWFSSPRRRVLVEQIQRTKTNYQSTRNRVMGLFKVL